MSLSSLTTQNNLNIYAKNLYISNSLIIENQTYDTLLMYNGTTDISLNVSIILKYFKSGVVCLHYDNASLETSIMGVATPIIKFRNFQNSYNLSWLPIPKNNAPYSTYISILINGVSSMAKIEIVNIGGGNVNLNLYKADGSTFSEIEQIILLPFNFFYTTD